MKSKAMWILAVLLFGLIVATTLYNYKHESFTLTSECSNDIKLKSPYYEKAIVYKGQLHCHTTNSDGAQSPLEVVTAYKNAGYDFIAVTQLLSDESQTALTGASKWDCHDDCPIIGILETKGEGG